MGLGRTGTALAFDTTRLQHGRHVITAVVDVASGATRILHASFFVGRLFVSPRGSESSRCTSAAPCASFSRAFELAAPGQAIEVADGYYDCRQINGTKADTVVFVAAKGATPTTTCELRVNAQHLAFNGVDLAGIRVGGSSRWITLRNVDVTCEDRAPFRLYGSKCSAGLFIAGPASDFAMYGGSVGPTWDSDVDGSPGNSQIGIPYGGGPAESKNLLFDGVRFHDNRIAPGAHSECLMVGGGNGLIFRNMRFDNCNIFGIYFTWWNFVSPSYPVATNILIENSWFEEPLAGSGYYAVRFGDYMGAFRDITVRYNSWDRAAQHRRQPQNQRQLHRQRRPTSAIRVQGRNHLCVQRLGRRPLRQHRQERTRRIRRCRRLRSTSAQWQCGNRPRQPGELPTPGHPGEPPATRPCSRRRRRRIRLADTGRYACHRRPWRHVARDHRAGADECADTDAHSTEDDGARTDRRPVLDERSKQLPVRPPPGARRSAVVARGCLSFTNMTPCPTNTSSSISTPSQTKVWLWILQRSPIRDTPLDLDEGADSRAVSDRAAVEIRERMDDNILAERDVVEQPIWSVVRGLDRPRAKKSRDPRHDVLASAPR